MNGTGIFVTGTDTEIGKTYVSRLLADTLARTSRVSYLKPVQTGCERGSGGALIAPDVEEVLAGAAMRADSYEMHVPYRFAPACSPHLAAELAGVSIDLARIHTAFDTLTHRSDVTIVEGAGGIHVPLGDGLYTLDLIAHLGLPVIVVTTPRLGTLNHTLLTVSALRHRGLRLLGVVYNNHANRAKDFIYKDNRHTIEAFVHPAPMVEIDHGVHDGESIREFCDEIRHTL